MWDILDVYNMKDFIKQLVKWFKCKMCCASECSLGEKEEEEKKKIKFNYRRNSI